MEKNIYAKISHELRAPISTINMISKIAEECNDLETLKKYVKNISNVSDYTIALINDYLNYNKYKEKGYSIKESEFCLNNLIKDINDIFLERFNNTNKKLIIHPNNTIIISDYIKIKQLLINLINNSYQVIKENGIVNVDVNINKNKYLDIEVSDNGPGISENDITHIFTPFYQGVNKNEGTGLGLAIVKEIVDLFEGQIKIFSNNSRTKILINNIKIKMVDL